MVSATMTAQVNSEPGIESETFLPTSNKSFLGLNVHADKVVHSKDQFDPADDFAPKARKPYTITKQRERWTEDEHDKFLEALKLYGRAWRKIEEHIGSKTAVQIRSHAQKFFSKVARDSNVGDEESTKPIEIPPPRPKRKPMHPYPRKLLCPVKTGISIPDKPTRSALSSSSVSEQEDHSPTSVLSTIGSDASIGAVSCLPNSSLSLFSGTAFVSKDEHSRPNEQIYPELEISPENNSLANDESTEPAAHSLRLFGKTLIVSGHNEQHGNTASKTCQQLESFKKSEEICLPLLNLMTVPIEVHPNCSDYVWNSFSQGLPLSLYSVKSDDPANLSRPFSLSWLTPSKSSSKPSQEVHNPTPIKAQVSCDAKEMPDIEDEIEGSSTGSNTSFLATRVVKCRGPDSHGLSFERKTREQKSPSRKLSKQLSADSVKSGKGFVPYKRCPRTPTMASNGAAEEPKNLRIGICL